MLPPICKYLGVESSVFGGWLYSSVKSLMDMNVDIKLAVATIYSGKAMQKKEIEGVVYYLLPIQKGLFQSNNEHWWTLVNNDFRPDLVHIHGTEKKWGLEFVNACPNVKSLVSIQGLISVIARYYLAGLPNNLYRFTTLYDFLRGTLKQTQKRYYKEGEREIKLLQRVNYVIGRTTWDEAHTLTINPLVNYFICNETLRDVFYKHQWKYESCIPHTIFVSQASYPVKGFHQLLKALPLVIRKYPDTKVYVAGSKILETSSLLDFIRFSGYANYLKKMISQYNLSSHIVFTGYLDENQICEYYLKSNVFVSPSSIENSPNSLGEAQLLGMPCIASYVGGVPDFMKGFEDYMYRFDEFEMLAKKICDVFDEYDPMKLQLMRNIALRRHSQEENSRTLLNIYRQIINS